MKLHLGSGKRSLYGFSHVDVEIFPHIDFVTSIDDLSVFGDETVNEIYCSHALEYFDRSSVNSTLDEWYRVLKKGAKAYITVPNFDSLLEVYKRTKELKSIIGPLFGRWENTGATLYHKTVWNSQDLTEALKNSKFKDISEFNPVNYLEEIDPDYDDYSLAYFPHMDRGGIQISLALVATK
jgi:ubiquinone/menaquinone biosynthesis C-methylase UbiE